MDNLEKATIRDRLNKISGIQHVREVTTFDLYRELESGAMQQVNVAIYDDGPAAQLRWSILATSDDGKTATGNSERELDVALAVVHWQNLGPGATPIAPRP